MNTLLRTCVVSLIMAGSPVTFASTVSTATVGGDHVVLTELSGHAEVEPAYGSHAVAAGESITASQKEVKTGRNLMVHEVRMSSYSPPIVVIDRR